MYQFPLVKRETLWHAKYLIFIIPGIFWFYSISNASNAHFLEDENAFQLMVLGGLISTTFAAFLFSMEGGFRTFSGWLSDHVFFFGVIIYLVPMFYLYYLFQQTGNSLSGVDFGLITVFGCFVLTSQPLSQLLKKEKIRREETSASH